MRKSRKEVREGKRKGGEEGKAVRKERR